MSIERDAPSQTRDSFPPNPTAADRLRALIKRAGLSQRGAAKLLNIEERTMRQWCAGEGTPPASVFRALNPRLTDTEYRQRLVDSNEKTIEALQDGRMAGMGFGSGTSDPQSVATEIDRLRKQNEEHRSLIRLEEAFNRRQEAFFALQGQWLPHGSGLPTEESLSEVDAAEADFRARNVSMTLEHLVS